MRTTVWTDIGLDFIKALPCVGGKFVILTVVDRFSKYCHFIPLAHPYTAESVAKWKRNNWYMNFGPNRVVRVPVIHYPIKPEISSDFGYCYP
jgi:hypothetical protein